MQSSYVSESILRKSNCVDFYFAVPAYKPNYTTSSLTATFPDQVFGMDLQK